MRLVDGHLFDGEWYERSELLRGSHARESGYCVVIWTSDVTQPEHDAGPKLMGPFSSADVAWQRAMELRQSAGDLLI